MDTHNQAKGQLMNQLSEPPVDITKDTAKNARSSSRDGVRPTHGDFHYNPDFKTIWQNAELSNSSEAYAMTPFQCDELKMLSPVALKRREAGPNEPSLPEDPTWFQILNMDKDTECGTLWDNPPRHSYFNASSAVSEDVAFGEISAILSPNKPFIQTSDEHSQSSWHCPTWTQVAIQDSLREGSVRHHKIRHFPSRDESIVWPQEQSVVSSFIQLPAVSQRIEQQNTGLQRHQVTQTSDSGAMTMDERSIHSKGLEKKHGMTVEAFWIRAKRMGFDPGASLDVAEKYSVHKSDVEGKNQELDEAIQKMLRARGFGNQRSAEQMSNFKRNLFWEALEDFSVSFPRIHIPTSSGHLEQQALYLSLGLYHTSLSLTKMNSETEVLLANCQLDAMKWQLEIINTWIHQMSEEAGKCAAAHSRSLQWTNLGESSLNDVSSKNNTISRRPGRPPGSKNKQTFTRRQNKRRHSKFGQNSSLVIPPGPPRQGDSCQASFKIQRLCQIPQDKASTVFEGFRGYSDVALNDQREQTAEN